MATQHNCNLNTLSQVSKRMAVQQDQRIRFTIILFWSGKLSVDDGQENKSRPASDVAKLLDNNKLSTKEKPDSVSSESKIKDTHEIDNLVQKGRNERKSMVSIFYTILLEERKKKHKKAKQEDDLNFPGREEIKFGEVVQAPPKLVNVPKDLLSLTFIIVYLVLRRVNLLFLFTTIIIKGTRGGITSDGFHHSHYPIRKCHVINHISITSDRNGLGVESLVMGIPIYKY
ncbi:hypothetical protein Hanom_Chr03g00212901 [Helianthus anomalus]